MKACENYHLLIRDQVAGELSPDAADELARHLEECPACHLEAAELEQAAHNLRRYPEEPPPRHFFVYEDSSQRTRSFWSAWSRRWQWAAAAVVLAAAAFAVWLGPPMELRFTVGSYTVSLGDVGHPSQPDPKRLQEELAAAMRTLIQDELRTRDALQDQSIQARIAEAEILRSRSIEPRLEQLEQRLTQSIREGDQTTRERLEGALNRLGWTFVSVHQDDMRLIREELRRAAELDRFQVGRTTALMAQVSRITETRSDPGGIQ